MLLKLGLAALIVLQLSALSGYAEPAIYSTGAGEAVPSAQARYEIELSRWGIYKDGTHPVETTKGINNALKWAAQNGKTVVSLPSGTYLVDKNSRIDMVGDMTFELPPDAILRKETNGKEKYELMYLGYGVNNVTLRGGVYEGDRETHDYKRKDNPHTSGTHEHGSGIVTEGASNVTIEGVKAAEFTGDGLFIGGHGTMVKDLYENGFVQGELNAKGINISNPKKIRTRNPVVLNNEMFKTERYFELSNAAKLPGTFDIYFYRSNGRFLEKQAGRKMRDIIPIPDGAAQFHLVFDQAARKGAYVEVWNRVVSENVIVRSSEFAFNRRQGITVAGGDNIVIENNSLHDIKGTAPQSGIDLEGGFGENGHRNSNITIRGNKFYNNAAYDLILYDGRDAVVEDNHFASKGAIGLSVSEPFTGATVRNNHFDGTRLYAAHDATFLNNRMNDSYTTLSGPNIKIDGMSFTDSKFSISAKTAFGVSASNITIENTKKSDTGLVVWGKPVHLKNVTITGEPALRAVTGGAAEGSIFDNLKVVGFNSNYGLALPPGTYNNCEFEGAEGGKFGAIAAELAGKYVFNGCVFKSPSSVGINLLGNNPKLDLTVRDSTFELLGNTQAISVQAARSVVLENNTITAVKLTNAATELIKLNDVWKKKEKNDILKAVIRGNTITANIAAVGISTVNAGVGAPAFTVENNTLVKAKLALKGNDIAKNNTAK
ncbi:right-handed parallel beta-helix repeat-containing protein [Paenibacillus arenilitoris]|uniref:Right-handed parallel beta-helix repeat-containing protein n=1 Tax=Paenibacillus arenilitoris TaxID=2772299 RepID=A0A927CRI7_9BACL|nr:right-handed parallel beta-helix repeat-containing protein [Paenibacillus arenilitoris]MBD2872277.1 right-handed parallel beta-helix repeat-containing protein [Paenibacillus arenilitoris]